MYSFAAPVCPRCVHEQQRQVLARLRALSASDISRDYASIDACTWGKVRRVYAFWSSDAARRQCSVGVRLDAVSPRAPTMPEVEEVSAPRQAEMDRRKEAEARAYFREATPLLMAAAMTMFTEGNEVALQLGILGEAMQYYARKFILLPAALAPCEAALVSPTTQTSGRGTRRSCRAPESGAGGRRRQGRRTAGRGRGERKRG